MNVEIGTETPIFLFWEYLFQISVFGLCSLLRFLYLPTGKMSGPKSVKTIQQNKIEYGNHYKWPDLQC